MSMLRLVALLCLATLPGVAASGADAGDRQRGDQAAAFQARRAGKLQPLDQIVKRVSGQLPGWDYTGFDFDADSSGRAVYKLVYVRDGNVTWIYVDGRTGDTIGRR